MMTSTNATSREVAQDEHASESAAIVVSHSHTMDSYRRGLEPPDINVAMKMCGAVAATGICGVKSDADAFIRVLAGRELGLTFMQSIHGVYVVEGKPGLYAEVMEGLCTNHPDCERWEFTSRTNESCTLVAKRRGRAEQSITWTIDDAKRAGLVKDKGNWVSYPRRMLTARCRSEMAGLLFADVMRGIKSREDLGDEQGDARPRGIATRALPAASMPDAQADLVKTLLHKIIGVQNKEGKTAVHEEIQRAKLENRLSGTHLAEVLDAYNTRFVPKGKTSGDAATTQPAAQPEPATAQSGAGG